MKTHVDVVKTLMNRQGVRDELERIEQEEEGGLLDAFLKARQDAGLTQADLAKRMGTQAPAIARVGVH